MGAGVRRRTNLDNKLDLLITIREVGDGLVSVVPSITSTAKV
jgi:hypothetical protein